VRIHPFANGNGRTARLWANFIAMRYGLPPFVTLRPRPGDDYGAAAAAAMDGDWRPTERVFRKLLGEALMR
jgi:Fic family protein